MKTTTPRSLFLFNPKSGTAGKVDVKEIKQQLKTYGWHGSFIDLGPKGDVVEIIRKRAKKHSNVIVAGGDGSVSLALNEVAKIQGTLGIIPLGTGNVLASHLGITATDLNNALRTAVKGRSKRIDIGLANGIYFAVAASMGVTVAAMQTSKKQKKRWGIFAYLASGFKALRSRPSKYRITIDDQQMSVRANGVVVTNLGTTFAGIEASPGTKIDSGDLGLIVIGPGGFLTWFNTILHALMGNVSAGSNVQNFSGTNFIVESLGRPRKFECDGDIVGTTKKLEIKVFPKHLRVHVPATQVVSTMAEKKPVIIFDFDGTLGDTFSLLVTVYHQIYKEHGLPPLTSNEIEHLRGLGAREVMAYLKVNPLKIPSIVTHARKIFFDQITNVKTFPEMKQVLTELQKKYILGIVTSNDTETVHTFLRHHQMEVFDFVYSEKNLFGKGQILKHLLNKYSLLPNQVTYIGDEVRDIEAAREAGMKSVSVSWGFNTKEVLSKHHPDQIIDDPRDLLNI